MPSNSYTPEQRAADAEIALAMGTHVWLSHTEKRHRWITSKSAAVQILKLYPEIMAACIDSYPVEDFGEYPRFHESHDARAALLEWLEGQGNGYLKDEFIEHLAKIVGLSSLYQFDNFDLFKLMLATPAQVAESALKVIKEIE